MSTSLKICFTIESLITHLQLFKEKHLTFVSTNGENSSTNFHFLLKQSQTIKILSVADTGERTVERLFVEKQ